MATLRSVFGEITAVRHSSSLSILCTLDDNIAILSNTNAYTFYCNRDSSHNYDVQYFRYVMLKIPQLLIPTHNLITVTSGCTV